MKLTEKIHMLRLDFEIVSDPGKKIPRFVNVIIVFGDKIILVDTGVRCSKDKIFDYIRHNNRDVSEISTVILSHSHPDHMGAAAEIKDITGCSVLSHKNEKDWIEDIDLQNRERPVPGFHTLVDRSVKVDCFIGDGDEIRAAGDITMRIAHVPGHSRGSLNILFNEDRILFTADSIPLKNDIPNYDSFPDLMRSLQSIKGNKNYDMLLTSWTPPVTGSEGIERLIDEGMEYMKKIDKTVREIYQGNESEPCFSAGKQ